MTLIRTLYGRGVDPTPRRGNILNWIGDSIAPTIQTSSGMGARTGTGAILRPDDFVAYAHLASNGWLGFGKMAGVGGQDASNMVPRIVADALSDGGHFCGIATSVNDASHGRTLAQYVADIRAMCALIVAAGQTPVLQLPLTYTTNAGRKTMDSHRRFLTSYGAANGWPVVDFQETLLDSSTGGYVAAYDNDGIHPNDAGKAAMGQVLADTLIPWLVPFNPPISWQNDNAQTANLLPNSLFLTDANADGVPDSWSKSGSATCSIVTGDTTIKGNAVRLVDTASSGFSQVQYSITITGLPGHKMAFTGLFKNPGPSTSISLLSTGAATNLDLRAMSASTRPFTTWQRWYLEGLVPSDATGLIAKMYTGGGASVDVSMAQVGVYDLTAAGL